jgi:FkbM family methyltransferase
MRSYSLQDVKGKPLDWKLDELFGQKRNGCFIELGANNGLRQSNTAFFARERDWRGVLIEPSPSGFSACLQNRPESRCFHAACVAPDYSSPFVEGDFNGNLMSSVDGKRLDSKDKGKDKGKGKDKERIRVPARTLESILDECDSVDTIDLLSLDTEGYELPILRGLNLEKYRPRYMLIELYQWDYEAVLEFLGSHGYTCLGNFSNYNKEEKPDWDGTHNDYLFKLNC